MPRLNKSAVTTKGATFLKICGLTLVEMLIVTVILGVVSLAINAALNSGVRVWRRINQELPQEDLNIFFDKFSADLHNSLKYADQKLVGQAQELELPTLVTSLRFPARLPGKIAYVYNSQDKTLSRKLKDYSDIYNDDEGMTLAALKNVQSLEFSYAFIDNQTRGYGYLWQQEWDKEDLPRAAKVELEIKDEDKIRKFSRTVSIPVSN